MVYTRIVLHVKTFNAITALRFEYQVYTLGVKLLIKTGKIHYTRRYCRRVVYYGAHMYVFIK